jgi:uncharacterized protein (DUF427 family)
MTPLQSKGKEVKFPGPDHPMTITPAEGSVRVTVAGRIVAESTRALRLEEKGYPPVYYLPRDDTDMSLLALTTHDTYCPYKGDCTYFSVLIGETTSEYAVWTYEKPHDAAAIIKDHLAFYPSRVDAIELTCLTRSADSCRSSSDIESAAFHTIPDGSSPSS